MGIFQSLSQSVAKEVGMDPYYRKKYQAAHPEDPECQMCGKQLHWNKGSDHDGVNIDHIWPQKLAEKYRFLAKPLSSLLNLQALCRSCNSKKGARISSVNFEQSLAAIVREIRSALDELGIRDNDVGYEIERLLERHMND